MHAAGGTAVIASEISLSGLALLPLEKRRQRAAHHLRSGDAGSQNRAGYATAVSHASKRTRRVAAAANPPRLVSRSPAPAGERCGKDRRRRAERDRGDAKVLAVLLLHAGDVDDADLGVGRPRVERRLIDDGRVDAIDLLPELLIEAIHAPALADLDLDAAVGGRSRRRRLALVTADDDFGRRRRALLLLREAARDQDIEQRQRDHDQPQRGPRAPRDTTLTRSGHVSSPSPDLRDQRAELRIEGCDVDGAKPRSAQASLAAATTDATHTPPATHARLA